MPNKALRNDVRIWLSGREKPWLLVLDDLATDYLSSDISTEERLRQECDMHEILKTLLAAKKGNIIITARHVPSGWHEVNGIKHKVQPMETMSASSLINKHLSYSLSSSKEQQLVRELAGLLDGHPQAIHIACGTIKYERRSIDSYICNWNDVFHTKLEQIGRSTGVLSLSYSLKLSYDALKRKYQEDSNNDELSAVELLNMLACFSNSHLTEGIFRRAWLSKFLNGAESKGIQEEAHPRHLLLNICLSTIKTKTLGLFWGQTDCQKESRNIGHAKPFWDGKPDRLDSAPIWKISGPRTQLNKALCHLEELCFIEFSDTTEDVKIIISPFIQTWVRSHCRSELLESGSLREAWWQASLTLSASLKPYKEDRNSNKFSDFEKAAATHVEELRRIHADLDSTKDPDCTSDLDYSSTLWAKDVLDLEPAGGAASIFADALDLHGYPQSALQLREALQLISTNTYDFHTLHRNLIFANSLTEDGRHRQALNIRTAAQNFVQSLQVQQGQIGSLSAVYVRAKDILDLMIQRDISDSHWRLGNKKIASEMLGGVLTKYQSFCAFDDQKMDGQSHMNSSFNTWLIDARIERARYLVHYDSHMDEARDIIDEVLIDCKKQLTNDATSSSQHRYFTARVVLAEILSSQGQYREALSERREILMDRGIEDPQMRHLDTMIARVAYANSLTSLDYHKRSLAQREMVERSIQGHNYIPKKNDFILQSRQSLAICYMDVAGLDFDKRQRRFNETGQEYISRAVFLLQDVWKKRQLSECFGPTHPETLDTLILLISCERLAEIFQKQRRIIEPIASAAIRRTQLTFQSTWAELTRDTKRAWFRVQLEDCLVFDPAKRLERLQRLKEQPNSVAEHVLDETENISFEFEVAKAQSESLSLYDRPTRSRMRTESRFKTAAYTLKTTWERRVALLGRKHKDCVNTLIVAIKAYNRVGDYGAVELQKTLCDLYLEIYGEKSEIVTEEANKLERLQNDWPNDAAYRLN